MPKIASPQKMGGCDFKTLRLPKIYKSDIGHTGKVYGMTLRKCIRCGLKDESEFNFRDEKRGLLQYVCRDCQREQMRDRYANNRERQSTRRSQTRASSFIQEYLSDKTCADCGEGNMDILTFDHVRGKKKYNISNMIAKGYNIETIKTELEKTETVCFNCHMRRERKRNR
jgi:hypothetical protein